MSQRRRAKPSKPGAKTKVVELQEQVVAPKRKASKRQPMPSSSGGSTGRQAPELVLRCQSSEAAQGASNTKVLGSIERSRSGTATQSTDLWQARVSTKVLKS